MRKEAKLESGTLSTEKKDEPRLEKPRGREADGTWANLVRVRKSAMGG